MKVRRGIVASFASQTTEVSWMLAAICPSIRPSELAILYCDPVCPPASTETSSNTTPRQESRCGSLWSLVLDLAMEPAEMREMERRTVRAKRSKGWA